MRSITQTITLAGLLLLSCPATADTGQVSSYVLDLEFQPFQNSMQGQATVTFNAPLEAGAHTFYLHGELEVESLSLQGDEIDFRSESVFYDSNYALVADKITFELAEAVAGAELSVVYRGYFHPSAARSPSVEGSCPACPPVQGHRRHRGR